MNLEEKNAESVITIVLVNYPYVSSTVKYPIGLLNLKSVLEKSSRRFKISIIDFNRMINDGGITVDSFKNKDYMLLTKYILSSNPDMIGFSTIAISLDITLEMAAFVKKQRPNVKVFIGGPAATALYEKLLQRFAFIDFVFLGESESCVEAAIIAAYKNESFKRIKANIAFREKEIICTKNDAPKVRLNELPYLDLNDYKGLKEIDIEVGRGCPFNCYFCATCIYWHRRYELKSIDRLISEITFYVKKHSIYSFNFIHDMFTFDRAFIVEFCKKLVEGKMNIMWACSARIDCIDEDLVKLMKNAGCSHIFVGIETGSKRMQTIIRKGIAIDTIKDSFDMLFRNHIDITASFVYEFPEETDTDLLDTLLLIQYIIDNYDYRVVLTKCTFYPDTDVYKQYAGMINTFIPTGDYLSLHNPNPSSLVLNNSDLFTCFFSLDGQTEYPYLDVFINFYIRLIKHSLPNLYSCLIQDYSYFELYHLLFHFIEEIDNHTRMLYEKELQQEAYYEIFYKHLANEIKNNNLFTRKIRDAYYFDILFIKL